MLFYYIQIGAKERKHRPKINQLKQTKARGKIMLS
jgi:hypothetical protein